MTVLSRFLLPAAIVSLSAFGGDTHIWTQGDYSDFQKGIAHNLSLRSDGLVTLAPRLHELYDTSLPYLWAVAQDSKGIVYAGGGTDAKLFRIPPDGKGKLLAEFDTLAVQAIAIDSKDRVYAATAPDGKVYRVGANGKPDVFFDPKAKYIWALTFDKDGNLYVATGDQGEIYRVGPDGKGKVFFKTDEAHVRCMAFDANGNLIVGTDPGGLVLRISPAGEGFVLYQMPKKEVTAVAVARDGSIYAAAVGGKQSAPSPLPAAPVPTQVATVSVNPPGTTAPAARPAAPPPASLSGASSVSGGTEVYRIEPNGNPERVWTNSQDVVYAIAFDDQGRAILGAGNHGNVYRIESSTSYTSLVTAAATQITGFFAGAGGRLLAVTGNVGKVYEVGPGLEHEGTLESDVFDAGMYTLWGRLSFEANLEGGQIAVTTRSGNLDQPQKNWSPWSAAISDKKGSRIGSPAARFVQWKAALTAAADGRSPELESVDVAFLPKNVAPRLEQIEITPPNYKFPAPSAPATSGSLPSTLSLPALGHHSSGGSSASSDSSSTSSPTMSLAKGYLGARWVASDPNGDSMLYTVEIRGTKETEWKLLKDKVTEKYFSWDSTAFPDGEYRLRITASDSPSNPPADALTARLVSEPFLIDNTPPRITNLTATRNGNKIVVRWHAADALNDVAKAEYSLDGCEWTVGAPVSKLSDSPELDYELTLDAGPGEHTIAVRVTDDYDNQAADKAVVQ